MDKGTLIILYGGSKVGKSTLLDSLTKEGILFKVNKYSNRQKRGNNDDITNGSLSNCDIRYHLNNNEYGFNTKEIGELINRGKNVGIILSDIDSIKKLRDMFKNILVYYIVCAEEIFADIINKQADRLFSCKDDILINSITDPKIIEMCNSIEFYDVLLGEFVGIPKNKKYMDFFRKKLNDLKSSLSPDCKEYKEIEALLKISALPADHQQQMDKRTKENLNLRNQYDSHQELFDSILRNHTLLPFDKFLDNSIKKIKIDLTTRNDAKSK